MPKLPRILYDDQITFTGNYISTPHGRFNRLNLFVYRAKNQAHVFINGKLITLKVLCGSSKRAEEFDEQIHQSDELNRLRKENARLQAERDTALELYNKSIADRVEELVTL